MKKLLLIVTSLLLITNQTGAATYISEIINNTNGYLKLEYSAPIDVNVLSSVSLDTNKPTRFELNKSQPKKVTLLIEKHSKILLGKGSYIPDAKYDPRGYLCNGILLIASNDGRFLSFERPFALIRQRSNWIELVLRSQYTSSVCDGLFKKISKNDFYDGDICVLTINQISDEFHIPSDVGGYKINEHAFEVLITK